MKHRPKDSVETPIASLIDVVFLLIIFFVVTASVEKDLTDETIRLAQAKHVPPVEKKDPGTITINVRRDGEANIALQPMSPKALQNILTATREKVGNHVPILIRGDSKTIYGNIDRIMEVIGKSGLYRVSLAAESTDTGE
jgi:biopolymer transport protein ExbD